jgi:hypothetical protein
LSLPDRVSEMSTISHLTVEEELAFLREVAESRGWVLRQQDPLHFSLRLPASDETHYYLSVDCNDYPVKPPSWHWSDADGGGRDNRANAPTGAGFLHPNGIVCAPWNRLSYQQVDARGPHPEWVMGDWRNNPHTKGCKTLCAMALRIFVELNGPHYQKRVKPN